MLTDVWVIEILRAKGWREWSIVATEEEAQMDLDNLQKKLALINQLEGNPEKSTKQETSNPEK